jgi:RNA polymerase sigma-70 factor (ECF subfamily)
MKSYGRAAETSISLPGGRMIKTTETLRPAVGALSPADKAVRFWDLARPHKQKLYNYIQKSLAFSTDADDVFQDTLLRGLRYFRTYQGTRSFPTWLFAIAHNEIRRHFRRARRQVPAAPLERLPSPGQNVDRTLVREVYRLAERLKPKAREVFFLFYDSGFSVAEISSVTRLRQGNVKFILNRARMALRKSLGGAHE